MFWLFRVILTTIERASGEGPMFSFLPDYYLEACSHAYNALKGFFHPTRPYTELEGRYNETWVETPLSHQRPPVLKDYRAQSEGPTFQWN